MKAVLEVVAMLIPLPSFAQGFEFGPDGFRVRPYGGDGYREEYHHHRGGDDCRELRLACLHKDELGEQGQGNCQRYRENCQNRY